MIAASRSLHLALLSVVLLLGACFQNFLEIRTVDTEQGVAFEVPHIGAGLREGQRYELLDLTVMKRDCRDDCTMWFVVREGAVAGGANLDSARIVYGREPAGMVLRTPARALQRGRYSVSATVQQYGASGDFMRSLSLDGVFSIHEGPSGNQRVGR